MSTVFRYVMMTLGTVALALASAASFAQSNEELPEITVKAETPVVRDGFDANHRPVEIVQLSRRVGYADLNVGTHSGAVELQQRVEMAAKVVCDELERSYPNSTETDLQAGTCVQEAINSAKAEVDAAIAAAERAHQGEGQQ